MIKGHSKIELFNKNGKKVYENDNMITNALSILAKPFGFNSADSIFGLPLYKKALGGIMLFNSTIDENANNIFPDTDNTPIGYGGQYSNSGDDTTRGSFNIAESGVQENGSIKMVWDFNTAQANGIINSLALTSASGGNCGFGKIGYDGVDSANYASSSLAKIFETNTSQLISSERILFIDYESQKLYTWIYKNTAQTNLIIKSYDVVLHSVDLKSAKIVSNGIENTIPIPQALQSKPPYLINATEDGKCYFYFYNSGTLANSAQLSILEIELLNNFTATTKTITNNTTETLDLHGSYDYLRKVYISKNGYFWAFNSAGGKIYKIKISDSTDTQVATETSINSSTVFCLEVAGRLYFGKNANQYLRVINTESNELRCVNDAGLLAFAGMYGNTTGAWSVNIRVKDINSPFFACYNGVSNKTDLYFCVMTNYLATINNLATPVEKTSDTSMKITYTLVQSNNSNT